MIFIGINLNLLLLPLIFYAGYRYYPGKQQKDYERKQNKKWLEIKKTQKKLDYGRKIGKLTPRIEKDVEVGSVSGYGNLEFLETLISLKGTPENNREGDIRKDKLKNWGFYEILRIGREEYKKPGQQVVDEWKERAIQERKGQLDTFEKKGFGKFSINNE